MNNDYFYKFGYNSFGPILLNFCHWIHEYKENHSLNKLFFLSRDGKIIRDAYNLLYEDDNCYFHTSRRAIIVPSLYTISNVEDLFKRIAFNKKLKLRVFIKKIGLEDYDLYKYLKKYNLNYNDIIDIFNYKLNSSFVCFLEEILPIIKENAKHEYDSFIKYASKMDFKGKVGIVDIGWYGTMQKALETINLDAEIHGLYVGMVPKDNTFKPSKSHGFLFDDSHDKSLYDKFHYFISIFEFMFLSQEGSTKKYINSDPGFTLYDYEYSEFKEKDYAALIQRGAIDYVRCHKNDINFLSPEECSKKLLKVMLHPKLKDACLFGNLLFLDDETCFIAKPQRRVKYLFNLNLLKRDFINSTWRIGFFKRLFVLPISYYRINNLLRKIFLKEEVKK